MSGDGTLDSEVQEFQSPSDGERIEWEADMEQTPFDLKDAIEELGLNVEMRKAADMVDQTFLIMSAKTFPSTLNQDADPFFCRCFDEKGEENFGMVIGGQQPVELLTQYIASGRVKSIA